MIGEKWMKLLWTFLHNEIDRLNEGKDYCDDDLIVSIICINLHNYRVKIQPNSCFYVILFNTNHMYEPFSDYEFCHLSHLFR